MKLGEIKLESLRLMGANDQNLSIEQMDNYLSDDRYRDYLDRMPGAINRAISRFLTYKVVPTKTVELKPSQGETIKQFLRFNLKEILSDFGSLERIIYIYERVVPNINYQTVTDGVILIPYASSYILKGVAKNQPTNPKVGEAYNFEGVCKYWNGNEWEEVKEDETFTVEYVPILESITNVTPNHYNVEIPEALARMIPYFVKAELFEQEEPNLSATARNIFESALTEYMSFGIGKKQRQQYVVNTFF